MSRRTKRKIKATCTKILAGFLAIMSLILTGAPVFANEIYPEAQYLTNEATYMMKNKASGKYLTLPGYFDIREPEQTAKNNVYQVTPDVNAQYGRTVRIVRDSATGKYYVWACLFEEIGNEYLSYDTNGNAILSSTLDNSVKWIIQYDESKGGYIFIGNDDRVLTSANMFDGSLDETARQADGNIIVDTYTGNDNQIWILERYDINPHIFKGDGSVTKKNLSKGAEWIIQLSNSEMINDKFTVSEAVCVANGELVKISTIGKYVIVRMEGTDYTDLNPWDNYAVIQISVSYNHPSNGYTKTRTVIIQDLGENGVDGCKTMPIYNPARASVFTVKDVFDKTYSTFMLTFKSDIGSVNITKWEIQGYDKEECCLEFEYANGVKLCGNNFAIVNANRIGFANVWALSDTGVKYAGIIEVQHRDNNGNVFTASNVIDIVEVSENAEPDEIYARCMIGSDRTYLLKTGDELITDSEWLYKTCEGSSFIDTGINYAIYSTHIEDDSGFIYVNNEAYFEHEVRLIAGNVARYVEFVFKKPPEYYLPNGTYIIENIEYEGKCARKTGGAQKHVELHNNNENEDNQWTFRYYSEECAYAIVNSESEALMLDSSKAVEEGANVIVNSNNSTNPSSFQLWYVVYNLEEDTYTIINKASYDAGYLYVLSANSGLAWFDGINVINDTPCESRNDRRDEWDILIDEFTSWYYKCPACINQGSVSCENCYYIDFWMFAPSVSVHFKENELENIVLNQAQYVSAVEESITIINSQLELEMTFAGINKEADINIYVTSIEDYESIIHKEVADTEATYDVFGAEWGRYNNSYTMNYATNTVQVRSLYKSYIGIFVYSNYTTIRGTIIHEMGHAIGLNGHTSDPSHIMYPIANSQNINVQSFSSQEIDNLLLLYRRFT